jgi:hypothetical protein
MPAEHKSHLYGAVALGRAGRSCGAVCPAYSSPLTAAVGHRRRYGLSCNHVLSTAGVQARRYVAARDGDADKDHFSHSMGMPFGVSERQGRSPGAAKHQPPLDIEAPPQQFDICQEMGCRVGREIYVWVARVRRASSGSALVEQNDPIDVGIKRPPRTRGAARTRSAMEHERRLAGGIAARLPIELVPVTGLELS